MTDFAPDSMKGFMRKTTKESAYTSRRPDPMPGVRSASANALTAITAARNRNTVDNGWFRTNQRAVASGFTLPSESYGFDRWMGGGLVNRVLNPTGGASAAGWTTGLSAAGGITTIAATIPGVSHQNKVIRCTMAAGEAYGFYLNGNAASAAPIGANCPKLTPGKRYTFSVWLRPSVAKTIRISARTVDTGAVTITTNVGALIACPANTWQRYTISFTADDTAFALVVIAEVSVAWAVGNTLDVGAAILTTGDQVVDYFDGSTGAWSGTANASTSYNIAPGTMTFTASPQGQDLTLSTGTQIQQVIERANLPAGAWVLSWQGTALGRVYNRSTLLASLPAFTVGPILVALDGLDDVVVEFRAASSATLGKVQLEVGSTATPFEVISVAQELAACQRRYRRLVADRSAATFGWAQAFTTGVAYGSVDFGAPMAAVPHTMDYLLPIAIAQYGVSTITVTSLSLNYASSTTSRPWILLSTSGLTIGAMYSFRANSSLLTYLGFSADF